MTSKITEVVSRMFQERGVWDSLTFITELHNRLGEQYEKMFRQYGEGVFNWLENCGYISLQDEKVLPGFLFKPKPLEVTFGIEFEGNLISNKGIVTHAQDKYYHISGWGEQADPTAEFEHRSPIWRNIQEACESVKAQYSEWSRRNYGLAPFFRGNKYHSRVGGHIHVGYGSNKLENPVRLARILAHFLPFTYFIDANGGDRGCLSLRMFRNPYSNYVHYIDLSSIRNRQEINLHEGTNLELRMFDANAPPIILACAFLLVEAARRADVIPPKMEVEDRQQYLVYPPNYRKLLEARARFRYLTDVDITQLPEGLKEVLVLSFCFLINPAKFVGTYSYEFCYKSATELKFLDAIKLNRAKKKVAEKIRQIIAQARTLGDLLRKIVLVKEVYAQMLTQGITVDTLREMGLEVEFLTPRTRADAEEMAREMSQMNGWYRIMELREKRDEVLSRAQTITGISPQQMIEDLARYYFLFQKDELKAILRVMWIEKRVLEQWVLDERAREEVEKFIRRERLHVRN